MDILFWEFWFEGDNQNPFGENGWIHIISISVLGISLEKDQIGDTFPYLWSGIEKRNILFAPGAKSSIVTVVNTY